MKTFLVLTLVGLPPALLRAAFPADVCEEPTSRISARSLPGRRLRATYLMHAPIKILVIINDVMNLVLPKSILTQPQSFAEFHSTRVRTRNVFIVLNYVLKIRIYIMLIAPIKIIVTLNDVISPVHLRS